jgi:hypothetical protein
MASSSAQQPQAYPSTQSSPADISIAEPNINHSISPIGEGPVHSGKGLNGGPGIGMTFFNKPVSHWVGPSAIDYS